MSGHVDHPGDKGGGAKRDTSPSAYSQSSGLEWDPSADVGTSISAHQRGVQPQHDGQQETAGTQTETRGHIDNEVAGPSTGRPRMARSRSYEYPVETPHDDMDRRQHKSSLGELANAPMTLVQSWVRTSYLNPEETGETFLETMVSGFTHRRQFIDSVQAERPSSTSTVVSTIMPPPQSRPDSQKSINSETASLPKDLKKLDVGTDPRLPRPHSNGLLGPSGTNVEATRSLSMIELGIGAGNPLYDSTTAPTGRSSSIYSKPTMSSAFAESLDRARRNKKDSNRSANDPGGINDWLELGMTKSEKELRKLKEKLTESDKSESMIFLNLYHNAEAKSNASPPPEGYEDIACRNIGVQTTSSLGKDSSAGVRDSLTEDSNIYHSTPTDRPRNAQFLFRNLGRPKGSTEDSSPEYDDTKRQQHKEIQVQQQQYDPKMQLQHENKRKPDRRRERSPPQPFAVASRKSSHRHHHAHHTRNHDTEISSFMENKSPEVRTKGQTSSSSELSPPCFLIDKVANTKKSPIKKRDIVSAIESHRDYHVKKVRHELKQLEKLNQLLSKNLDAKHHHRHPQKSSTSETDVQNSPETHADRHQKANPPKSSIRSRSPPKPVPKGHNKESSSTSSSSNPPPKKPSLRGIDNLLKDIKQTASTTSVQGQKNSALEKKLDELMDAFSFIAGMLLEKDCDKKEQDSSAKEKKKPTTPKKKLQKNNICKPCKPPVAYFIPFQNCQGQYTFRRADIQCFGGRQIIDTASRTVSRQQEEDNPVDEDSCWEDVDAADEDAENRDPAEQEMHSRKPENKYDLQAAFERRCPNFLSRLRDREAVLAQIKSEREIRAEKKREWVRLYGKSPDDLEELDAMLPPKGPRLMTTQEMREITKRHYKNLPEVQEKVIQRKAEEERKTNRIMSQVFAQQLRKGVLKGEVNHVHSRSLVRR